MRGAIGRKDEARPGSNHARHVIHTPLLAPRFLSQLASSYDASSILTTHRHVIRRGETLVS